MDRELRHRAGHYEVLGETYAKFEFFEHGWNPYSRFLDVDKVDLILRRVTQTGPVYREVQVKFGKLYQPRTGWQSLLFDATSWRFFNAHEFDNADPSLFVAYVMSPDEGYRGDIFIFPVGEFAALLNQAPAVSSGKRRVFISRCLGQPHTWVLRKQSRFQQINQTTCVDVSAYWRNFDVLAP